jgi:hypothetical protein
MTALDFSAGNTIGIHPCIDDTDIDGGDTEYQMSWTGLAAHDQSMGYGHMLLVAEPEPMPVDPGSMVWSHNMHSRTMRQTVPATVSTALLSAMQFLLMVLRVWHWISME